jgi:hypothetical protein
MTDGTGLLQHAAFSIPRYEDGYCLDDNARALLLLTLVEDASGEDAPAMRALASRYLAFVRYAFDAELGRFRNFMTYRRAFTEACGSEDSHGRALWALGAVVGRCRDAGRRSLSSDLFQAALSTVSGFESPRGWAFSLLGIHEYLRAFPGDGAVEAVQRLLSGRLLSMFEDHGSRDWLWCEDRVTYDNARLPQALILSGSAIGNQEMTATGLSCLAWLAKIQRSQEGYYAPVGSNGFYPRAADKALFDQQPLEACGMVSASFDAWRCTRDPRWAAEMRRAFLWFLGHNQLRCSLYDPATGGCRDGLHADRANENQGAESTLSFLLALTDMRMFDGELQRVEHRPLQHRPAERSRAAE